MDCNPYVALKQNNFYDLLGHGSGVVVSGRGCRLVKLQQESEAGCLRFNRISCRVEGIYKFAKGRVSGHISDHPSLAAMAMLGNLDYLVRGEAQSGLARVARERHGFDVFQAENDPALNGHRIVLGAPRNAAAAAARLHGVKRPEFSLGIRQSSRR
jgi:hypothetical protein